MIEIEHLHKYFGTRHVLRDISFSLARGRQLALIGPTAAGKTVLLKCLVGLYDAHGVIKIDKIRMHRAAQRNAEMRVRIGMLFQRNALFDSLSVWENIAHQLLQLRVSRADAYHRAVELLSSVGLEASVARLYPADLSGGMQKRVGFARAIAAKPDILLLDNPTAGLDPILTTRIREMITRLVRANQTTTITVTSDMNNITQQYDDIAVLDDGYLRWYGTATVAEHSDNPWLQQLRTQSRKGPIQPQSVRAHRPNLKAQADIALPTTSHP